MMTHVTHSYFEAIVNNPGVIYLRRVRNVPLFRGKYGFKIAFEQSSISMRSAGKRVNRKHELSSFIQSSSNVRDTL